MSSTSPDASSMALIHEGWDHLRARRPLAARASWQRALRLGDDTSAAAQAIATLESAADLPAAARSVYRLRPPADAGRRGAWDDRLCGLAGGGAGSGGGLGEANLAAMADAFGRLAAEGLPDPAAWYNRALCLAWLGSNREAVACLDRVVELEAVPAPDRAVEAWTLAELLRQGEGPRTWPTTCDSPARSTGTRARPLRCSTSFRRSTRCRRRWRRASARARTRRSRSSSGRIG